MTYGHHQSIRRFILVGLTAVLTACASPVIQESTELIDTGHWQEGLARLERGMREYPDDPELRIQYHRRRERTLHSVLDGADTELAAGRPEAAEKIYRQVLAVDGTHARATQGLHSIELATRHEALMAEARAAFARDDTATAAQHVKVILTENLNHAEARALDRELREREQRRSMTPPVLKSRLQNAVNLDFRDAPLKLIIEALSRSSGINFVFDRDVRPDLKTTIVAREVRVEDAIDMILAQNQLEKKVLSENAVLVYPSTPQKLRENQDLVMRVFHLGNADVKQTVNLLRTMVKTKDIFVDERMNMLVIRDTPDVIRIAEKLIGMHDMVDPEVVLEIEILEVSRTKVRELGITYPSTFTGPGGTLAQIGDLTRSTVNANSGFAVTALRTDGDTKTLANPRVRVRNKEKARVHVGDRVPVISSTLVGAGSGGAPVSSEQIQYLDVGIKVEAEPVVHPDNTVAVKVNLDVSSLGAQTRTTLGTVAYEVGTRNVNTVLRLRDGETQALMGLIRDDDTTTRSGIPFLGELPILDVLFGNSKDDQRSRELVLLITPHIIRGNTPPDATLAEFWSGTEARMRAEGPFTVRSAAGSEAVPGSPVAAPASQPSVETLGRPLNDAGKPAAMVLSWTKPEGVQADKEFAVSLNALGEGNLKAVTVSMRYRPTELELVAVEDGGYFKRGGGESRFTPRTEPGLGMIVAALGAGPGGSVPGGEGSLVTLRFKPIGNAAKARVEFISVVGLDHQDRQVPITGMAPLDVPVQKP
jgi:general secretion pathway protein D